jgi:hypothetical protein
MTALPLLVSAQLPVPADINLFGDDIVRKIPANDSAAGDPLPGIISSRQAHAEPAGYPHALFFQDGRQLRGELIGWEKNEIVWLLPDAAQPLRIPILEVSRIALYGRNLLLSPNLASNTSKTDITEELTGSTLATIRLAGSDWLRAKLSTKDGENFSAKTVSGLNLSITKNAVDWVHFGPTPEIPICYLNTESAFGPPRAFRTTPGAEVKDGLMVLPEGKWLASFSPAQPRVEITLEIREDSEGFTSVLFPSAKEGKKDVTATVVVQFNRNVLLYRGPFADRAMTTVPVSDEDYEPDKPSSYRILYDAPARHLVILRNGKQLVDRTAPAPLPDTYGKNTFAVPLVTIESSVHGGPRALALHALRIQPWSGILSKAASENADPDYLCAGEAPPVSGKLESISPTEGGAEPPGKMTISGKSIPIAGDLFLKLGSHPSALENVECRIDLKEGGELSASKVSLEHGTVECRAAFARSARLPLSTIDAIQFPTLSHSGKSESDETTLVFKNGDELAGTLVASATNKPVRWKTASGQEVEFTTARIAGIRSFSSPASTENSTATVELCNGDRICGDLAGVGEKSVRFHHPQLGELTIEKTVARRLFPNARLAILDGARAPLATPIWVGGDRGNREAETAGQRARDRWIYLDGAYILKMGDELPVYALDSTGLLVAAAGDPLPGRFQFSFDVTDSGGSNPEFNTYLGDDIRGPGLALSAETETFAMDLTTPKNSTGSRKWEASLQEKLHDRRSRIEFSAYVDSIQGTADIYLDGIPIALAGHKPVDRLTGLKGPLRIEPADPDNPIIYSNIRVAPWNGELPKPGTPEPVVNFTNGDVTPGQVRSWHDGKCTIESNLGTIVVTTDAVQEIDFANPPSPEPAAARLRLADGSILHVDRYRCDSRSLTGHSKILGDFQLPVSTIRELILDPAPLDLHPNVERAKPTEAAKSGKTELEGPSPAK